jgi:membrane protease subunit (stomatin/prohibitin family)
MGGIMKISQEQYYDMVNSESCIGKTVELTYKDGQNKDFPVYITFNKFVYEPSEGDTIMYYTLLNKNTDKYQTPKPFQYSKHEFLHGIRHSDATRKAIRVLQNMWREPSWEI